MPKEKKKRGRRELQRRQREEETQGAAVNPLPWTEGAGHETADEPPRKRARSEGYDEVTGGDDYIRFDQTVDDRYNGYAAEDAAPMVGEMPFYGLLSDSEQDYFKQTDALLAANDFGDDEEREVFLTNLYKEANGKELKLACSQSCSRLMEKLVEVSSPSQLKILYQKFSGQFVYLAQHRFASHCCEALLFRSAQVVTAEQTAEAADLDGEERMQDLIVAVGKELQPHIGFCLTQVFGSHVLRALLLVLAGRRSNARAGKHADAQQTGNEQGRTHRTNTLAVPQSFKTVLSDIIALAVAGLETAQLRSLATHPIANPTLQLLLELELQKVHIQGNSQGGSSLLHKFLSDNIASPESESAAFLKFLLYDSIGSRLLETIIAFAPGKVFKQIYSAIFKEYLGSICRNEVASFVVNRVLERLGRDELAAASAEIEQRIPMLLERSRTVILKTLIERLRVRNLDLTPLAAAITAACTSEYGLDLFGSLQLHPVSDTETGRQDRADGAAPPQPVSNTVSSKTSASRTHNSLLVQTMLSQPGPLQDLVQSSLIALGKTAPPPAAPRAVTNGETETNTSSDAPTRAIPINLLALASRDRATSYIIQLALRQATSSAEATVAFRRQLIPFLVHDIATTAADAVGSHVVDALWIATSATSSLHFLRERIATALVAHEHLLKRSLAGRAVWRNWKLDLFKRGARREWADSRTLTEAAASLVAATAAQAVDNPRPLQNTIVGEHKAETQVSRGTYHNNRAASAKSNANANATSRALEGKRKSALDLARERHAKNKRRQALRSQYQASRQEQTA